jgi:hypothetical protein
MPSILNATTTTGLVSSGDNSGSLQLATNNGTAALTIDTSQNVGIGTASPSYRLDVSGTSNIITRILGNNTNDAGLLISNANNTNYGTISAMGSSGYGVTGWANSLVIESVSNSTGGLTLSSYNGAMLFQTGTGRTERMRITSTGDMFIGRTSDTDVAGISLIRDGFIRVNRDSAACMVINRNVDNGTLVSFRQAGNTVGTVDVTTTGTTYTGTNGITFTATQTASAGANTLDDYEEGTWTPAIQGSSTAGTASYSNNAGRYTKIGRQVFVEAFIDWFSGTGTGNLRIGNLPFTATNDDFYRPGVSIGQLNNVALTASNIATAWIDKNTSFIAMQQYPVGGGTATDVAYDIAGRISFSAVYTV